MMDFEAACFKATTEEFPEIAIKGCHFHLGQSWYRKLTALGLSGDYKDPKSDIGRWLKECFALPGLSPDDVQDMFSSYFLTNVPVPTVPVTKYPMETYIDGSATFHPKVWAGLLSSDDKTTNNGPESFHRHFADLFSSAHPNIFSFLDALAHYHTLGVIKARSINPRPVLTSKFSKLKEVYSGLTNIEFVQQRAFADLLPPRM